MVALCSTQPTILLSTPAMFISLELALAHDRSNPTFASIPAFAIGTAELAQMVKHRKAVDEMLRSRKAKEPAKKGLGGTILLHEHLQRQHQSGAFAAPGPLCRPKDPVPYYCLQDQAKFHYCMEVCDRLLPKHHIKYRKGDFDPRHKGIYEEKQQI